mmetsp:Transcript_99830/g.182080  ORF Transcript_99830/g.182080 Transcript_99830/m.182080 type:complete len:101 (+) Transcript_99830:129-431(+)
MLAGNPLSLGSFPPRHCQMSVQEGYNAVLGVAAASLACESKVPVARSCTFTTDGTLLPGAAPGCGSTSADFPSAHTQPPRSGETSFGSSQELIFSIVATS